MCLHGGASRVELQTIVTTSRLPHAWAYLRKVAKDGECVGLRREASRRETALLVVPMRAATSSWVRPASLRACSSVASAAYSSSSAWPGLGKAGALHGALQLGGRV